MTTAAMDPTTTSSTEPEAHGHWDWWLLVTSVLLAGLGLLMILSATSARADADYGDALHFVTRQGAGLALGVLAGVVTIAIPRQWLRASVVPLYVASLVAAFAVLTPLGTTVNGAARWIAIGSFNLQPSELCKLTVVLMLSRYLAGNAGRLHDVIGTVVPAGAIVAAPVLLVLLEPDFGTTAMLVCLLGVLLFVAGLQLRWLAGGGVLAMLGLATLLVLEPYRVRRLTSFLDPYADPDDAGYQVVQGWIAMGNGRWFGQGIGTGVAQAGFLPEAHNDFIAAVVGEELGALGWVLVIAGVGVLVWRGTRIAANAKDLFSVLVASGVTMLLAGQALVNLMVVVGWLPNKGLVLPFFSYGSNAAIVHVVSVALLLRIGLQTPATDGLPDAAAPARGAEG